MTDVSRETPPAPPAARGVFGSRLPLATAYAEMLAGAGTERGLLGPREVPRLWERHLLNCAVLSELIPARARVADVGSGAGLPGVVLAIARPDLQVTLIEPLLRRTTFLEEVVAELALEQATVLRARAEEAAGSAPGAEGASYDVVTSRAVAPLDRLSRWCLPLTRPGGVMLAMKGSSAPEEIQDARSAIRRLGGAEPEVLSVGAGAVETTVTVVRVLRERGDNSPGGSRSPKRRRRPR